MVANYLASKQIPFSEQAESIVAIVRGQRHDIVRTDVQMKFTFDNSGKLIGYSSKEVYAGP